MNSNNYKQYDTRWAKLGYPYSPHYIRDCGCGEVSVCNCIIEMDKYKNETPKTIQPYCKQYAAPNGNGTYFSGIPAMMKHYGMTEVKEHDTMPQLFTEMAKGNRVAILLMGSRKGGSRGVHWTSSAHFVAAVGYKKSGGKDYLYIKDSNSTSTLRNGWLAYTENLRGDVSRVWSGKLPAKAKAYTPTTAYKGKFPTKTLKRGNRGTQVKYLKDFLKWRYKFAVTNDVFGKNTEDCVKRFQKNYAKTYGLAVDGIVGAATIKAMKGVADWYAKKYAPTMQEKICAKAKEIADSGKYRYKFYTEKYGSECPICYPHGGANNGFNCIGYAWACWHHAGIPSRCNCEVLNDMMYEKVLAFDKYEDAYAYATARIGIKDVSIVRNRSNIPLSSLKAGDIIAYFSGGTYVHTAVYIGNGKIADCTSSRTPNIKYGVPSYTNMQIKLAFRYKGK